MSAFNEMLNQKAVALSYDDEGNCAPIIVASGMGYLAQKMVEIADEHDVPVYEDNSLATMLTQLELGAEIPEELYQAIVDIYVYFLSYAPKASFSLEEPVEEDMQGTAVAEEGSQRQTD